MEDKIIFYDGVCNLCNFFVRFVIKNDKMKSLKFASLQSNFSVKKLGNYLEKTEEFNSVVLMKNEKLYVKSRAVFEIIGDLVYPVKILKIFSLLPVQITDYLYELIANKRYKIFGKRKVCSIPKGYDKSLFIDV